MDIVSLKDEQNENTLDNGNHKWYSEIFWNHYNKLNDFKATQGSRNYFWEHVIAIVDKETKIWRDIDVFNDIHVNPRSKEIYDSLQLWPWNIILNMNLEKLWELNDAISRSNILNSDVVKKHGIDLEFYYYPTYYDHQLSKENV